VDECGIASGKKYDLQRIKCVAGHTKKKMGYTFLLPRRTFVVKDIEEVHADVPEVQLLITCTSYAVAGKSAFRFSDVDEVFNVIQLREFTGL
jgi:hypothetical protein